jgi:TRAP-type C4-dicarboxylate transport system permease small subunit
MKPGSLLEEGATPAPSFMTRWIGYVAMVAGGISALMVVFTLVLTGYSVFQRYVLGRPLTWTDELSGFLVVAIVMLGAAETLRRGEHISVDLLSSRLTGRRRMLVDLWGYAAVAFMSAVLLISSWDAVMFSWTIGVYSDSYLEAPLWIPQTSLLVGSGLLLLLSVARILDLLFLRRRN